LRRTDRPTNRNNIIDLESGKNRSNAPSHTNTATTCDPNRLDAAAQANGPALKLAQKGQFTVVNLAKTYPKAKCQKNQDCFVSA